jgi:hypothetical protein
MKRIIFAGLLLVGVMSCSVENEIPVNYDTEGIKTLDLLTSGGTVECGDLVSWPFGDFSVGKVDVITDGDILSVKITANNDIVSQRTFNQSRISFYGLTDPNFPNSTQVGKIDNHYIRHNNDMTSYEYRFEISELRQNNEIPECGEFFVVVWANLTAKGNLGHHFAGNYIGARGNWKYFKYCVDPCSEDPPTIGVCETAFMSTNANSTLNEHYKERNANNWGWFLNSVDLGGSSKTYKILAGAGQNDISKGEEVGEVTVNPDGTYEISMKTGYLITEMHVYKNTSLPQKRQAPGLYRECNKAKDVVSNDCINGSFYLIIHMKVCWFEDAPLN